MKNGFLKKISVVLVLCMLFPIAADATQEKIENVQDEIHSLEQKKDETQQKVDSLSEEAGGLEGELAEFNEKLMSITGELNITEQQLKSTRKSLDETRESLEKAKKEEKDQYEAMKGRIRFLYESGSEGILEVLLSTKNFADFLNKANYISSIQNYDRRMLDEYKYTKETIAAKEQEFSVQEASLAQLKEQQEAQQQEVAALVSDTSEHLNAAKAQLAGLRANVAGYEERLKKQKAYERELEEQKAAEDAKRLEEIRRQEEEVRRQREQQSSQSGTNVNNIGNGGSPGTGTGQSDLTIMAALIECEAGGEIYEGKLAVGSVVMNRVKSPDFPNTVAGVIYQKGEFTPVSSGRFASALASGVSEECTRAAAEVLGGRITVDYLYFRSKKHSIQGTPIGNNVFY